MGKERTIVGISGWHSRELYKSFYPAGTPAQQMLEHYSRAFSTVEISSSFERLPEGSALYRWYHSTPADFVFAIQASRYLTHALKLGNPHPMLRDFLGRADLLSRKLGPILFQFPPHWGLSLRKLERFLAYLPKGYCFAFEFRNPSWFTREVYKALQRRHVALCLYETPELASPREITAEFTYLRLYGPAENASGTYNEQQLQAWANRLQEWNALGIRSYAYFQNTLGGHAADNAIMLNRIIYEPPREEAVSRPA